MTLQLLFITVKITKNHRTLSQELDERRKRELIESIEYKKSFYI
ncbi:hypothetical protein [Alkalihalobacillus sp. CinArs1]|nr:hypothetical protein [Alkalihalobacillus sp. CinArs1]